MIDERFFDAYVVRPSVMVAREVLYVGALFHPRGTAAVRRRLLGERGRPRTLLVATQSPADQGSGVVGA